MKIYGFPFAPNPRKLKIYVAEKALSIPIVTIDIVRGENDSPEFLAKNPMGSLPVLELDDGSCLTESLAIIEYLEELHPEPPMIGEDPLERARVRELERLAETSVFNRMARIFFNTSPVFARSNQVPAAAEQARQGLPRALQILDDAIGDRPFAAGSRPSVADCTLFAGLEHGERAGVELDPRYANLTRWYRAFAERPSVAI